MSMTWSAIMQSNISCFWGSGDIGRWVEVGTVVIVFLGGERRLVMK